MQSTIKSKNVHTPDGSEKQSNSKFETKVIALEEGPLDSALFEIPPGFRQVDHIERNALASAFSSGRKSFWQRVRAGIVNLFR
ncbi:MAG: hypothetical protein WCF68_00735 [Terriglobales bacterium]